MSFDNVVFRGRQKLVLYVAAKMMTFPSQMFVYLTTFWRPYFPKILVSTNPGCPEVATDLPLIQYLIHTPEFRSVEECMITAYKYTFSTFSRAPYGTLIRYITVFTLFKGSQHSLHYLASAMECLHSYDQYLRQ